MVGIQTTSFVAVLGAAGLAIGLALQGSLSNFAGGVLILIFRPYRVGDLIQAQGELGVVQEIQIFTTILLNPQNRRVIIPNGSIANGNIVNLSAEDSVRVDTTVGISYDADMKQAREVLMAAIIKIDGVLSDPAPTVAVSELGDSSVNLVVRPYCQPTDYWKVHFAVVEASKNALDAAGISIPFPQRDVHLLQQK
jgi:small conductance mechanosensitive channel